MIFIAFLASLLTPIGPDIITILEICNALKINLSQLFPTNADTNHKHPYKNPFNASKLYLYYYTENLLITSILELKEEQDKILVNFYNGIKNIKNYAKDASYCYEGVLECDRTIGYINLYNPISQGILLEKIQISFVIPWIQKVELTNFFILALTPNSLPTVKKGILSTKPIQDIEPYTDNLKISKNELAQISSNNAWILGNKNYDYFSYNQ